MEVKHNTVSAREQCPACADVQADTKKDNLARYSDSSAYCFACGYSERASVIIRGQSMGLAERGLTKEVVDRYGVIVKNYTGRIGAEYVHDKPVIVFPITKNNRQVAQKIRLRDNSRVCSQVGDAKDSDLFGIDKFTHTDKVPVVVCEAEIDAMTINQVLGYPAVSTGGTNAAAKKIANNIEWLSRFKYVVLCFDGDEAGDKAAAECVPLFSPGAVRVMKIPRGEDANSMLQKGRIDELKKCCWNAAVDRPKTILSVEDLLDKIIEKPERGLPWPFEMLNKATEGMKPGEIYILLAAAGIGKSLFIQEVVYNLVDKQQKVGLFSFEQTPDDTLRRLIGSKLNRKLHRASSSWWDREVIKQEALSLSEYIKLYNNTGSLDISLIVANMRYMNKCDGIKVFIVDNLHAMSTNPSIDGRRVGGIEYISHCVSQLNSLADELSATIIIVSHTNSDKVSKSMYVSSSPKWVEEEGNDKLNQKGLSWERGRMPSTEHIYGQGAVLNLADYVIALARDTVSESREERLLTKVKILKARGDSEYAGKIFNLYYNVTTGRLSDENKDNPLV